MSRMCVCMCVRACRMNGCACGAMVIIITNVTRGNRHVDMSSNPGLDYLHFHITLIPLGKV